MSTSPAKPQKEFVDYSDLAFVDRSNQDGKSGRKNSVFQDTLKEINARRSSMGGRSDSVASAKSNGGILVPTQSDHNSSTVVTAIDALNPIDAKSRIKLQQIYDPSRRPSVNSTGSKSRESSDPKAGDTTKLSNLDPNEIIAVPMIMTVEKSSFKSLFSGKRQVETKILVREMKRERYEKHYAKDNEGNYVGTEKPAPDAGLVYVSSKSDPEDLKEQLRQVAFGREHRVTWQSAVGSGLSIL